MRALLALSRGCQPGGRGGRSDQDWEARLGASAMLTMTPISITPKPAPSSTRPVAVSYRGIPQALTDLVGGQLDFACTLTTSPGPHVQAGRVRALAVTSATRTQQLPDVPTVEEASGIKGLDSYSTWYGLLVPATTPPAVVETLQKSITAVLAKAEVKQKINDMGSEVIALPGAAFAERIRAEHRRYEDVIRRFNIKPE